MTTIRLTEAEEGFCQDHAAGLDLLTCFRRNYPKDIRKDNKARYQAKIILRKDKISDRIRFLKEQQDFDGEVTDDAILGKAWEWVNRFPGKPGGIFALGLLAKNRGLSADKIVIEDHTGVVELQRNLFARRKARINGEEIPELITEKSEEKKANAIETDYEVVDEDDDTAELKDIDDNEDEAEEDEWGDL